VMLGAYTLTIALYGSAFGEYVAYATGLESPWPAALAVLAMAALVGLNLLGVGKLKVVEIAIVAVNLVVLVVLGVVGLADWRPEQLVAPDGPLPITAAGMGAAVIFVSYEGFQLLTYEYDEVRDPDRILTPTLTWSAAVVVAVYVLVGVGATMAAGAGTVIEQASVALSVAAGEAMGTVGLVAMTFAAAFATSAAINSTLFSSAKLARRVSDDGELPAWLDHRNGHDVPDRAIVVLGAIAGLLAVTGSLSALVEAASLAFLVAFGVVHAIAWREDAAPRWVIMAGVGTGGVVGVLLLVRLTTERPVALVAILALFAISLFGRPRILARTTTEQPGDG
jgi:amino acid transporter